ncbi:MAG: crossover junction endodeoxyribonuclease RuvC [Candidatus Comchoanobacterales bacterium]
MSIIGIDPGSRVTGWGILREEQGRFHYCGSGIIRLPNADFAIRMAKLYEELSQVMKEFKPEYAAVESLFVHKNANSALKLGHARGVILLACQHQGIPVSEYAPRLIKQAVSGYGHADKKQVMSCVELLVNHKKDWVSDESDALAMAICHANHAHLKQWSLA